MSASGLAGEIDPFTFFAGSSLRGDFGCREPLCRGQKLDFLGRYAALYATEVTVPLPMTSPDKLKSIEHAKRDLSLGAATLLRLRPLITAGIIKPAVMRSRHCVHTIEWANKLIALVHDFARDSAKGRVADFDIVYQAPEKAPTGLSTLYVKGPRDFLEHGSYVILFKESSNWRQNGWKLNRQGKTRVTGQRKLAVIETLFSEIADNTSFYLAFGRWHGARLLTDLPGEASFLNWLTGDKDLVDTTSALEHLAHTVPVLLDLPIATIVRIRREERDSFASYRSALTQIASDVLNRTKKLSKKEARDMFKALIEPRVDGIRKEMRFERKRQSRRIVGGLAMLAAGIAIGAFGELPISVSVPLAGTATITGGHLLAKAAEVACEHGANLQQQSDLYFLVCLLQEGDH